MNKPDRRRQISYGIAYTWNLKNEKGYKWTELYNRIWPTDIENKHFYQRGKGRDKLGAWDLHIYTTIYKINAHQGPPVERRELCWILCIKTIKEKNLKMNIHNWITVLYTWNLTQYCKSTILQFKKKKYEGGKYCTYSILRDWIDQPVERHKRWLMW